ncbi:MAG: hypothetical protein AAF570_16810, partial [Bacteroidota bacterium]
SPGAKLKIFLDGGIVQANDYRLLDHLRIHPRNAEMNTFSYHPELDLVTHMMDENHLLSAYEYDDFGRLKAVRNAEGNLISVYDYNYGGQ